MHGIFGEQERAHNDYIRTSQPRLLTTCSLKPRRLEASVRHQRMPPNGREFSPWLGIEVAQQERNSDACAIARRTDGRSWRAGATQLPAMVGLHNVPSAHSFPFVNTYAERHLPYAFSSTVVVQQADGMAVG